MMELVNMVNRPAALVKLIERVRNVQFHQAKRFANFTKRSDSPSRGFTLIETVIALALVTAALVGPFALAVNGIVSAKLFKNRLAALNLAQEGIEITRHLRENNVIRGHHWRGLTGPCSAVDLCSRLDDFSAYYLDVFTAPWGPSRPPMPSARLNYDTAAALYSHAATGQATPFERTIAISTPGGSPGTNPEMLVVATVTWIEFGVERQVRLEEILYDWKSP